MEIYAIINSTIKPEIDGVKVKERASQNLFLTALADATATFRVIMRIQTKVLLILFLASGILCLTLSFLPMKIVKSFVFHLCNEGRVNFFNYTFYSDIILRLRLLSSFMLISASLIAIYRNSLEQYFPSFLSNLMISYHDINNSIINYINNLIINQKMEILTFGFIFIVGIILRLYYLFTPIRMDEAGVFMFLASKSLIACIFSYPFPGDHVFYTIMVNILHNILGDDEWVMRLPAFFAGILLIPATYLLFRKISDNLAALLSSALVAVSSPLIEYSTNARGYTIVTFIFITSLLLVYYLSEHRNIYGWAIFTLLSAIGFYTIPIYLFPFGIIILWYVLLIMYKSNKYDYLKDIGLATIMAALLTFILYLPIFIIYGNNVVVSNKYVQSIAFIDFIKGLGPMFSSAWSFGNRDVPSLLFYFIAFGFIIFMIMIKYANKEMFALLISSVFWIFILLFIKRVNPGPRIWIFLVPIYFGLACTGLSYVLEICNWYRLSLTIFISFVFLTAIGINIILNNSIYNSDTGGQLLVDGNDITKYIKDHFRLKIDKVYVVNLTYRSPLMYYFTKYHMPLDHLLRYNSMENKAFTSRLKELLVIQVDHVPKERKETILGDAKVNVSYFQSCVLVKKFKESSLYLYKKE